MNRKRHYSGEGSKGFWRRVKRLKDESAHDVAYALGVVLQDVEHKALLALEHAESEQRHTKPKRAALQQER